jgi:hypothetical protein
MKYLRLFLICAVVSSSWADVELAAKDNKKAKSKKLTFVAKFKKIK